MLMSETMNAALNDQVNYEQYSSHIYLAMAAAFEKMSLKVFAQYYYRQADEERMHAMKMFKYIVDAGGTVKLKTIEGYDDNWETVEQIVQVARDHEIKVTRRINDLVALAEEERDYAARSFLLWFVDEQVQEVSAADELLSLVKMAGPAGLLYLEDRVAAMNVQAQAAEAAAPA